jgi:tetratricopeptide (TPR) repeat protein
MEARVTRARRALAALVLVLATQGRAEAEPAEPAPAAAPASASVSAAAPVSAAASAPVSAPVSASAAAPVSASASAPVSASAAAPVSASASAPVSAPAETPEALFQRGSALLARGEYSAAIDAFEALADRGFVHPDASYDRGVAYVTRVRQKADRPGDLGRAAAAFEEALRLRPDDADADRALDLVRAEITRRRSRRAKDEVDVRPTLDRVVVGLASEQTWGLSALGASLLLAAGMILRRRPAGPAHVAGSVIAPAALVALLALAPLTYAARHLRLTRRAGVIVVPEVYLADEGGRALGKDPIPEGASVEVGRRSGALSEVRWGAAEGWIPASSVRLLAQ